MAQQNYKYMTMAKGKHQKIYTQLKEKYDNNMIWPILWHYNDILEFVTFEINEDDNTNEDIDEYSEILECLLDNIPAYKVDYRLDENRITLLKGNSINLIVQASANIEFNSSHEYITSECNVNNYKTIDIDYLWVKDGQAFGMEVSTFYMIMDSLQRAKYLLKQSIEKRATLFRQLNNLLRNPFNARMLMAYFNQDKSQGGTAILENSNVIAFEINNENVALIKEKKLPYRIYYNSMEDLFSKL